MSWLFPYLRQTDPQWRDEQLGRGGGTVGREGCLVTAIAQAARALGAEDEITPGELNMRGIEADAFAGSSAIIHRLALCAGIVAPRALRVEADKGVAAMADMLRSRLDAGWVCLLRVDRAAGPAERHHWVLALAIQGDRTLCADPAIGRACYINPTTMAGESDWPSGVKPYEVDAVVPIGRA